MCGIAGFVDSGRNIGAGESIIRSMLMPISHRGPDNTGVWCDDGVGVFLGHNRLSIHDLSDNGNQPMVSNSGRFVLSYNGEIYNYLDVKKRLVKKGSVFKSDCDTEVLLCSIEVYGLSKALELLNGMFAFVLWDRKYNQLTLVRDRIGEKPLYYGWQGKSFIFGSELKALRAHSEWRGGVDTEAISLLLNYSYIPSPRTIHPNIFKLEPGEIITLTSSGNKWELSQAFWWSLHDNVQYGIDNKFKGSRDDAINHLDMLMKDVLMDHQLADVSVGAFLSGGIDSTLVVSQLQSVSSNPVNTFTIGSSNQDYDESTVASSIAKYLGTKHTEWILQPHEGLDIIAQLPEIYDEPFADASQIPTLLVSRLAKQKVTVALSGDGGDEFFGGYNRHIMAPKIHAWLQRIPLSLRHIAKNFIFSIPPKMWDMLYFGKHRQFGEKLHKLAKLFDVNNEWEIYSRLVEVWGYEFLPILGKESKQNDFLTINSKISGLWEGGESFSERIMLADSATYLPDDILVKVDRAAMSCSLETRVPLLDYRIVSFVETLPLEMKIYNSESKWILRQLLDRYLPRSLMNVSKSGFGLPLHEWLRNELREWAEDLLNYNRLKREGIFNPEQIRRKWEEHLSGKFNHQYSLWSVLMFQAWYEKQ